MEKLSTESETLLIGSLTGRFVEKPKKKYMQKKLQQRINKIQIILAALTAKLFFLRMVVVKFVCCACAKLAYNVPRALLSAAVGTKSLVVKN